MRRYRNGKTGRNLIVLNDDEIAPHTGFGLHHHENVEIVSYLRERTVTDRGDFKPSAGRSSTARYFDNWRTSVQNDAATQMHCEDDEKYWRLT